MAEQDIKPVPGTVFFAVFAVVFLCGAYAVWAPDFFGTACSAMTPGMIIRYARTLFCIMVVSIPSLWAQPETGFFHARSTERGK